MSWIKKHTNLLMGGLFKPAEKQAEKPTPKFDVAYTTGIVERLKVESTYRFIHRRKKTFTARYLGQMVDGDGDILLHVIIDTSVGSGAEHLSNAVIYINNVKLQPDRTEKWIKAKFIQSIEQSIALH